MIIQNKNYFIENIISDHPEILVVMAGILGSFVSALNRIYASKDVFPRGKYTHLLKKANIYLIAYSLIPPLIGAIGAAILFTMFAGEIISGGLFPEFACTDVGGCQSYTDYLDKWKPKLPVDFAKLIVWGFIAGFSERFVPNILNQIATDNNK
ncbi:hypothetical protein [Paraglaciecola sp. MB-3u-78]|uniref:hypothetical protein n=1 Tax=Paraglaciecola sp. MB-3u-78 TaxID=2058332 RepID=UPI000C31FCC7|nr:hypothetical protein [Paraglaciecola sp. MB-3u-78]PKH00563.1 hypothetical protein CXF95_03310 [Paraglaciecola sp. MB-3u-78]